LNKLQKSCITLTFISCLYSRKRLSNHLYGNKR